jgi:CDP-glycerol glycerophosphotransferase (TagB/SpsB family)
MLRLWRLVLRLWKPKLVYINNSYSHSAWPIIVACKELNIPTIEQQHGLIGRNHLAYLVPRHIAQRAKFPLCDIMVVWGEFTKRFLVRAGVYQPEQVYVCGFPRIDSLLEALPDKKETLTRLSITLDAKVVLYTSNRFAQGFMNDMLDNIAQVGDRAAVHWIIKLHPREKDEAKWQMAVEQRKIKNVTILRQFDFYALLGACDIHISFASTTLIEAAVLGKLNLGFKPIHTNDPAGFLEAGAYEPVEPQALGSSVLLYAADLEANQNLLAKQKAFAHDICLHDGQSATRIVNLVEELVKGKSNV